MVLGDIPMEGICKRLEGLNLKLTAGSGLLQGGDGGTWT